jgi:predicted phage terminase large subunit-like protein
MKRLTNWIASPAGLLEIKAEKARRRLIDFCTFTFPQYQPGNVHRFMADKLQAVERGEISRLMLFLPPRTGKTELLLRWIAWMLGRHPDWPVLYTSYGADLAWEKSRETRNIVASDEYAQLFGRLSTVDDQVELARDSRSVERWRIRGRRGGLQAQGVGGPLTGKGGRVIIVDDPVKNREEADSATFRRRTWNWYTSTLRTRLEPGGVIVLCMTRWHEDDLAGRLLRLAREDPSADQWQVVSLPALARDNDPLGRHPGEALDPGRYPAASLLTTKASVGSRDWAALYDQSPRQEEGNVFRRPWLRYVERAPEAVYECVVWDTALEERTQNDCSAAAWFGRGVDGRLYVRPLVNDRLSFPDLTQTARSLVTRFPRAEHLVEGKASGKSLRQQLRADRIPMIEIMPAGDKVARANAVTRYFEAGMVYFVGREDGGVGEILLDECEDQLLTFPRGTHDDLVDVTVYGIMRLTGLAEIVGEMETVVIDDRVEISPV